MSSTTLQQHVIAMSNRQSHVESSMSSSDESMVKEFWEDFDAQNELKKNKFEYKFTNIDDPLKVSSSHLEDLEKEINEDFNPNNPPLLKYYDLLEKTINLPSKKYLQMEKEAYRTHLNKIRNLVKSIVKRAKDEAKQLTK